LNLSSRQEKILKILEKNIKPVSGAYLSDMLNVTRQVIVKDIALMKASGTEIRSNSRGYYIRSKNKIIKTVAVKHNERDIKKELEIIISGGGSVIDITVEHPVYGEINASLDIENEVDIEIFCEKIKNTKPLSYLNYGIHLHKIETETEEEFDNIVSKLKENGFLL